MSVLETAVDLRSADSRANAAVMGELVADLRRVAERVREGGGETSRKRHLARGKLLPRDRIRALIDPASPFLEVGQLAAHGLYGGEVPSAGIITGIGRVAGRECMVVAERCDGERRVLLPVDREEASARAGDRAAEPATLRVSGG